MYCSSEDMELQKVTQTFGTPGTYRYINNIAIVHRAFFKPEIFWIREDFYCYIIILRPQQKILHICNHEAKSCFFYRFHLTFSPGDIVWSRIGIWCPTNHSCVILNITILWSCDKVQIIKLSATVITSSILFCFIMQIRQHFSYIYHFNRNWGTLSNGITADLFGTQIQQYSQLQGQLQSFQVLPKPQSTRPRQIAFFACGKLLQSSPIFFK